MSNLTHPLHDSFLPLLSRRRRQLFTMIVLVVLAAGVMTFSPASAAVYSVGAQNGPWQYVIGGLNSAYQFGVK